jgi:hypothetical protein
MLENEVSDGSASTDLKPSPMARAGGIFLFFTTLALLGTAIVLGLMTRHGEQPFAVQPIMSAIASGA